MADGSKPGFISVKTDETGVSVTNFIVQVRHAGHKRKHSELEDTTTPGRDIPRPLHGTSTALISSVDAAMQEIFSMLQKGTARTKLHAEKVCACGLYSGLD
jgi:hypothetical protein